MLFRSAGIFSDAASTPLDRSPLYSLRIFAVIAPGWTITATEDSPDRRVLSGAASGDAATPQRGARSLRGIRET